MAETSTVARPYAKAAFEYARDHEVLEAWSELLGKLGRVASVNEMQEIFSHPKLDTARKVEILIEVSESEVDDAARRFLDHLGEKGRLPALAAIAQQFEAFRAEHDRRMDVIIVSAFELNANQQETLGSALKKRLNREISITTQVDPSLLGGVILRAGDTVIDGSVRGRLNRLHETLSA
ncbi:ATP synthase subunit delta [Litchfieldella qijiaojingensis]|uniref:ATP synthase subunit delta n=1 Tax=Litchfieldella qijiaojingensis TaxID=980347 RepID=A0ABQ2YGM2_9GAMM|nr:F0F1 ATP synthase subunit delta [Halomonas qijiaojingensis]GGX83460.1 ATP synthase subunit delta [Halomonas qijiaojingensis]